MVNLEHLSSISKYPNLFNSADVDAIRELSEIYPEIISSAHDSIGLIKSEGEVSKYGFKYSIPTGIEQYEYFDGRLGNNVLFKY